MIYRDKFGYPVDETGDGGDSAVRAGILGLFSDDPITTICNYEAKPGLLVRHPTQYPWQNPWNFSRDQMMCLVSALPPKVVRRVLWATLRRFCCAQNYERDHPGTTKYPWPHRVDGKWRAFDFADPLLPQHIGHLIVCARVYWLYPFLIVSWPLLYLSCLWNSTNVKTEQNQLICMVKKAGPWWVKVYKRHNVVWKLQTRYYWASRGEEQYSDLIQRGME